MRPPVRRKYWDLATTCLCLVAGCAAVALAPCDKSRQVFTQSWGVITDGPSGANYTENSHCEWLIRANTTKQFITLSFQNMGTECSYDYVFVYDGDSFKSPLLGSFSGKTDPQQITATSGYMLILLYSDTNYALHGFRAEFSVTDCPSNCTNHGVCVEHKCYCFNGWGGSDCGREVCPDGCGKSEGRGHCNQRNHCTCTSEYAGQSCSLPRGNSDRGNKWHWLSDSSVGLTPRAAHTAVYINFTDSLYIFGGYNLNQVLSLLEVYSFERNRWENEFGEPLHEHGGSEHPDPSSLSALLENIRPEMEQNWGVSRNTLFRTLLYSINSNSTNIWRQRRARRSSEEAPAPEARYGHAACAVNDGFVIHGGKLSDGSLSNELWVYDVSRKRWQLRAQQSQLQPPALTRHTITLADEYLYLFGGSTTDGEFSSKLFRISIFDLENWEAVHPRGGKDLDIRLVAHTTVFHAATNSLIIYGGVAAGVARFSKLSDRMFAFQIDSRHWSELHYPREHLRERYVPRERAFHTTNLIGNYLVVFGGYSHRHNKEEICYDNQMYLYHLGCHAWINPDVLGKNSDSRYPKAQGMFAHASSVRAGNVLLLIGGYHGNVNGDLLAYVLPPSIAPGVDGHVADWEAACPQHRSYAECSADPECGWCSADELCYGRTTGANCTTNLQSTRCPGVCPALGDCHSCLIHGALRLTSRPVSIASKLGLSQCTWCVQNARCHPKDDNYGVCGVREDTPTQVPGWWGLKGTEVVYPSQCRELDRRPGLTFLKYLFPANWSQPDYVAIINATTVDFNVASKSATRTELALNGKMIARLRGYLRPPFPWPGNPQDEILKICVSFSTAVLRLTHEENHFLTNLTAEQNLCHNESWPANIPILDKERYSVDFESHKSGPYSTHQQSKMELLHFQGQETPKVFTFEYLEPFANGSCEIYGNCLHCLTDSLCGWCELTNKCLPRELNETETCRDTSGDWRYLTLLPSACANCSNYISCEKCVSSGLCEWWAEEALCARVGRSPRAVKTVDACPAPCHARPTCSACLDERGRCVWCEATQQCFSFSVYTSEYQFGLCREWLDQSLITGPGDGGVGTRNIPVEQCKSCSHHTNCSSCLRSLSCGWCYSRGNPIHGACVQGDFGKPARECSEVLNTTGEASWSYAQCPDVDECRLGLHNCHPDAECTNTHGSYRCQCRRGFIGDGQSQCTRTCYNVCVHGRCLGAPDYTCQCDLGWSGADCSLDCGCYNHSACTSGIGICDRCEDWTMGEHCENCLPGSYGNATTPLGCHSCDCNGHGIADLGFCDSNTGVCYCEDNTEGDRCQRCKENYYGDPRNGGQCYYECHARGMLTGFGPGGLGSRQAHRPLHAEPARECLWVIGPEDPTSSSVLIQLSINSTELNVSCGRNAVYVYDGLPDLGGAPTGAQNQLVGVYCSQDADGPLMVEARSGHLTVHYKHSTPEEGFSASYNVMICEDYCPAPRLCRHGNCVCAEGYRGSNCEKQLCPRNCSNDLDQGTCDLNYGRCLCQKGWGGADCSVRISDTQLVFTELFDTRRLAESLEHLRKTLPRFGHTLVADRRSSLWMFGGYSLSHGPLNDLRLFDTRNVTWMQVTVESTPDAKMPLGRYFHAAEIVPAQQAIYVYGGLTGRRPDQNTTLNDFWKFDIHNQRWSEVETLGDDAQQWPPYLAGHTLTLVDDKLLLIGGFSPNNGFLGDVWEWDLTKGQWSRLETMGAIPRGLAGHSTVFHAPSQTLYIFGGYAFQAGITELSNNLFSLHYPTKTWSLLYNPPYQMSPVRRFLHSAVTTEEFMLVFGGRSKPNTSHDILLAYVYACNLWIRLVSPEVEQVGHSPPATYAHAMTLDLENMAAYVVGGWGTGQHCQVSQIHLPADICSLWSHSKFNCLQHSGCGFCGAYSSKEGEGENITRCHTNRDETVDLCKEFQGDTKTSLTGRVCSNAWMANRDCTLFHSCSTCLATWAAHDEHTPVCYWCGEKCLSVGKECRFNELNVTDVDHCEERLCKATDCQHCHDLEGCIWAQRTHSSDSKTNAWACVPEDKKVEKRACPARCGDYKTCHECLNATSGEGGVSACHWSNKLMECISPSYQPIYCVGGVCGLVLEPSDKQHCPEPCANFTQCSTCLRHAHCGWCAKLAEDFEEGDGVCTEGSLDSPAEHPALSTCDVLYGAVHPNANTTDVEFSWNYVQCPAENECLNGHHTCDPVSEVCVDLPSGFQCRCAKGYRSNATDQCIPVCSQGCVRGTCVEPNLCLCDFGYVGANCSIQCQCNGHANCAGPDKLDQCMECHNNTMGSQCERCKPLFVGDPSNGRQCVPCSDYCFGHTDICMSVNGTLPEPPSNLTMTELAAYLTEGPRSGARCIRCANRTAGLQCEECEPGTFRGSDERRDACRPCECHGHGDTCDPVTGENCNCQNNTESDLGCRAGQASKNAAQQCWMVQCAKCRDSYVGTPTGGHQCYKTMTADNKMCFDAKPLDECKMKPRPLNPGETVFFAVQPHFMNVDIRIIVDVTQGSLDLFLSPQADTFIVHYNNSLGVHQVDVDPRYRWKGEEHFVELIAHNTTGGYADQSAFPWVEREIRGLSTYVTIERRNTMLVVRGLRDRLVLTLPQHRHELSTTKFYLVLQALDHAAGRATYGLLFFRQDQLHIDLFVFFSVFFSCFFLFLAACVVAWKAKQAADVRRARRRHVVEMQHMAKRPFASVSLVLGPRTPVTARRNNRRVFIPVGEMVRPVAIEPTEDNVAAVASVFIKLPGGRQAPVRLALASSLILLARQFPTGNRAFLRRRSNHALPAAVAGAT